MIARRGVATLLLACAAAMPARGAPAPAPLPPPRPEAAAPVPAPPASAPDPVRDPAPDAKPTATPSADADSCAGRLARRGAAITPAERIRDGVCRADAPYLLEALGGGVRLSTKAVTVCPIAEALQSWLDDVVAPEAHTQLGRTVTTVEIGESYSCRGQNRVASAKPSEHAFANALDVTGFRFDKGPALAIGANPAAGSAEARFLAAVRSGACRFFATVLGPGSDPMHADHLHLDGRTRRNGYRICQ